MPTTIDSILHRHPNLAIYHSLNGYTAVTTSITNEGKAVRSYFDINDSARDLLEYVDGRRPIGTIVQDFCAAKRGKPDENENWIVEFLTHLTEQGVLSEGAHDDDPLTVVGALTFSGPAASPWRSPTPATSSVAIATLWPHP